MLRSMASAPDDAALQVRLASLLDGSGHSSITVLDREPIAQGTYPKEIVTCGLNGGSQLRLFCKYAAAPNESFGHRGGVPYEAQVYRHVLQPLPLSQAKYYGSYEDPVTEATWVILGYLPGSLRMNKAPQPEAMLKASRWLGLFHAANQDRLDSPELLFLTDYDEEYYLGWARRTDRFAGSLHRKLPWLRTICHRFRQALPILLSCRTVIHGECYPANVLYGDGVVYPVDWESAAVAAGEIDLVTLTAGWPKRLTRSCQREYCQARWGHQIPKEFSARLAAARLYVAFRWTGERPDWTAEKANDFHFEELRLAGKELGLV